MMNNRSSSDRNLPSTYQKVLELVSIVQDLAEKGLEIDISSININNPPNYYTRDMTYELKSTSAIGLSGKDGIKLDHIFVQTVKKSSATAIQYPTWQCAYGDQAMRMYFRSSVNESSWTEWVPVVDYDAIMDYIVQNPDFKEVIMQWLEESGGGGTVHKQFIAQETQPADSSQEIGDYWLQPIGSAPIFTTDYFFEDLETSASTDVMSDDYTDYAFQDTVSGESIPSPDFSSFQLLDTLVS